MGGQRINNPLGFIQGRLLPKYNGRYQAHPIGHWEDEFQLAVDLGLDCIEFILDYNDFQNNPLMTTYGRQHIRSVSKQTGVRVLSVCADYFMEAPLHSKNSIVFEKSQLIMARLLDSSKEIGVTDIVVPCVDHSSIQDMVARSRFEQKLTEVIPLAESLGVNLSLETDLCPEDFKKLLAQLNSPSVTVNYDIGNSASLGYDPEEELQAYGSRISDIHIKDRILGGGSVKIGTGNADIPILFKLLDQFEYCGPLIMQAYRDDEGLVIFKEQLEWVRSCL